MLRRDEFCFTPLLALSVYETLHFKLLDRKSIQAKGISTFEWSPGAYNGMGLDLFSAFSSIWHDHFRFLLQTHQRRTIHLLKPKPPRITSLLTLRPKKRTLQPASQFKSSPAARYCAKNPFSIPAT